MNQGPPQTPRVSPTEKEPKILSFEEFTSTDPNGVPHYNNFFLHFGCGFTPELYRTQEHYKRFTAEHPEMAKLLCNKIQNRDRSKFEDESLKPFERELYETYKIMRGYGASDNNLFA